MIVTRSASQFRPTASACALFNVCQSGVIPIDLVVTTLLDGKSRSHGNALDERESKYQVTIVQTFQSCRWIHQNDRSDIGIFHRCNVFFHLLSKVLITDL